MPNSYRVAKWSLGLFWGAVVGLVVFGLRILPPACIFDLIIVLLFSAPFFGAIQIISGLILVKHGQPGVVAWLSLISGILVCGFLLLCMLLPVRFHV